jgi:hypothetical protein
MTTWKKLIESSDSEQLTRGMLLRFAAGDSFESHVVMMVCEAPDKSDRLGLITISGYKAGINCYVVFPSETASYKVSIRWLIDNWQLWVWPDGDVNEVEIHQPLDALEIE